MHSIERLIRVLERAPLTPYSGFSYRVIADKWRDSPLSAIGAVQRGGRYNAPHTFPVLYSADSQLTALLEAEALFTTADGQLQGVPRDPDLILTIKCSLERVLDLTVPTLYDALGASHAELVSSIPSRFILNARNEETPIQQLGSACSHSGRISALKVPSAAHPDGFCLDILIDSLIVGEHISIRDESGRIKSEIQGTIPRPPSS
ncbi:MAG: RES family NAD+ phosphorylase [Silvibacterium sp.]